MKEIRVLIADDFKVLRDVIRLYLTGAGDMNVVDEAPDLYDALSSAKALKPDVILMNDYLPPVDSAEATALFREQGITAAVLAISMKAEPELIHRSFRKGVNGFMEKDEIDEYLVDAIRRIARGERYLSPRAQTAYDRIPE